MTTTFADICDTPAILAIWRELIDGDGALSVRNMRMVCKDSSTFQKGHGVAEPIMFVDGDPRRMHSRYPKDAPPPTIITWNPMCWKPTNYRLARTIYVRRMWWFDPDPAWLGVVEEMRGEGPGMLTLLSEYYGPDIVLPLDRVRRLVASEYELFDVTGEPLLLLPALCDLILHVKTELPESVSEKPISGDLTVLEIRFGWPYGTDSNPFYSVPYVIRSVRHTLKELTVVGSTNLPLDKIMHAIHSCERLERLDLSDLHSYDFDGYHALCLPPSIREVRLNNVCLSGAAEMWDTDMNRLFTSEEWLVDVTKYHIDIKGIAVQCPRLDTVWHTGLAPFLGTIHRHTCRRECITCGCTRECDDDGDRVCWCDACAGRGCEFRACVA